MQFKSPNSQRILSVAIISVSWTMYQTINAKPTATKKVPSGIQKFEILNMSIRVNANKQHTAPFFVQFLVYKADNSYHVLLPGQPSPKTATKTDGTS